jgi:SRSO17 transposase
MVSGSTRAEARMESGSGGRFSAYVEGLVGVIGHADRAGPLRDYCLGLLLPGERKSVEPLAAVTAPARVSAQHQSLLHFVANAPWSDERLLARVRELVLPAIERNGPIAAWIVDDTSFPKKGRHSVGVARQYCGERGKQENCQAAVTLSIANHGASLPVAHRLYLPEAWAADPERRRKAGVPEEVGFATKPAIALAELRAAVEAGIPRGTVLMDAGYGVDADLRRKVRGLGLAYVAGVRPKITLWPADGPCVRREMRQAKALALGLPPSAWETVAWREGSNAWLRSRFARLRVRAAHSGRGAPGPEEWLLVEWPEDAPEPARYWLSTLPEDMALAAMVDRTQMRWRIERDYQELKQQLGLGHYEGRGWRGFHHHASLCIAAYGFLISERETIPPSGPRTAAKRPEPALPADRRPGGAPDPPRTARPELDRDGPPPPHGRPRQRPRPMSMLPRAETHGQHQAKLVTQ